MDKRRRYLLDGLMTALLLLAMAPQFTGSGLHELLGAAMLLLFLLHQGLNLRWYGRLFRGRYGPARTALAIVDALLLAALLTTGVTGALISPWLRLGGGFAARAAHSCAAWWSLVLTGLHVGLHLRAALSAAGIGRLPAPAGAAVSALGLWAFAALRGWEPLIMYSAFGWWQGPLWLLPGAFLAAAGLFACAGYYLNELWR